MNEPKFRIGRFALIGEWPPEIVPLFGEFLSPLDPILPTWCHECRVYWDKTLTTAAARCRIAYDYRTAYIEIGTDFLTGDRDWQMESLIHEVVHVSGNIVVSHAKHYLQEALKGDENKFLRDTILMELTERNESMTCDLARAFFLLLKQKRED